MFISSDSCHKMILLESLTIPLTIFWITKQKQNASPYKSLFVCLLVFLAQEFCGSQFTVDSMWMDSDGEKKIGPINQTNLKLGFLQDHKKWTFPLLDLRVVLPENNSLKKKQTNKQTNKQNKTKNKKKPYSPSSVFW